MAVPRTTASLTALVAVAMTVFSLLGASLAADAPTPGPSSPAAAAMSPSLAFGCLVTFVAFLFGSALKI
ncbi:hypothetical protein RHGRI_020655 [Rhododendron griersonianum]|uniref:Uncharacterized protein n=1 Tax=Rhododendron griersonianum TaxID=479676 RepID=A0AAV6JL49_9ERIC|nr:hypothetical protein RHGRI_020655 [Rhododendron griersonianum]